MAGRIDIDIEDNKFVPEITRDGKPAVIRGKLHVFRAPQVSNCAFHRIRRCEIQTKH